MERDRRPFEWETVHAEGVPADRAAALIELAEKNAPRLGSEERQLIVAYAEAVDDNDKVIGLINRLCEQGYELQKGQMDSFVKSPHSRL